MTKTIIFLFIAAMATNTFAAENDDSTQAAESTFFGAQLLAVKVALLQKGLPVETVTGWPDGGLIDDAMQTLLYVGQKTAALVGKSTDYDGHYRLEVVIARPGRGSSIRCDAWVEFNHGTHNLHYLETRDCDAVPSLNVRHALYRGELFGPQPDLRTERNCLVLAPGASVEGENRQNCQIVEAVAAPDDQAANYNIVIQDTDIFHGR